MSWQPYQNMSDVVNGTGTTTGTISTPQIAGYYLVKYYIEPASVVALSTCTFAIGFTSGGTARTIPSISMSLASLTPVGTGIMLIKCDANTPVTYTITSISAATYNLRIGWKPDGS